MVVIGAGPIGIAQMQLAKASGADVLITDVIDSSLELAKELGADVVVNTKKEDGYSKVLEFTGLRGTDIAFECAGGPSMEETLQQATSFARIGCKVMIVGGFDKGKRLSRWNGSVYRCELKLIPGASYSFWDIYLKCRYV